ncbi:hypothetical protein BTH160X_60442 [Brochothrix thermosphacta]|nr:hypothetical protein BTH160X_60442 [Brochothrix thermosphacta]
MHVLVLLTSLYNNILPFEKYFYTIEHHRFLNSSTTMLYKLDEVL